MSETGLNEQLGDNVETVVTGLAEAIAWCVPRVDVARPKGCLRSIDLLPHPFWNGRKRIVDSATDKRYAALGRPKKKAAVDLAGGRLLFYEPDVNLYHGLEEDETQGYVDCDNTPPWDSWIAYIYEPKRDYLLAWVPPEFIPLVTGGINVSPERSFQWLDLEDLVLPRILRERGLM